MTKYDVHITDAIDFLDEIGSEPDLEMTARLDAVLDLGFALTQANVHVKTGSLKTSGKKTSRRIKTRKRWEGEISYGGPSGGPNNPVDYAIYEQERDGAHDFMEPLIVLHEMFIKAIHGG